MYPVKINVVISPINFSGHFYRSVWNIENFMYILTRYRKRFFERINNFVAFDG
jgi:hypothetical protein